MSKSFQRTNILPYMLNDNVKCQTSPKTRSRLRSLTNLPIATIISFRPQVSLEFISLNYPDSTSVAEGSPESGNAYRHGWQDLQISNASSKSKFWWAILHMALRRSLHRFGWSDLSWWNNGPAERWLLERCTLFCCCCAKIRQQVQWYLSRICQLRT